MGGDVRRRAGTLRVASAQMARDGVELDQDADPASRFSQQLRDGQVARFERFQRQQIEAGDDAFERGRRARGGGSAAFRPALGAHRRKCPVDDGPRHGFGFERSGPGNGIRGSERWRGIVLKPYGGRRPLRNPKGHSCNRR